MRMKYNTMLTSDKTNVASDLSILRLTNMVDMSLYILRIMKRPA